MKKTYAFFILALAFVSCGKMESEYSKNPCYVNVDNSIHNDATLNTAINSNAPGIFCQISESANCKYFVFKNNQGLSSQSLMNASEIKQSMIFGFHNGIIVGFGNIRDLSDKYPFYAYDLQCPNCYNDNAIPARPRPLTITSDGLAKCSNCGNIYNMNNGGNYCGNEKDSVSGSGRMTRYYGILCPSASGIADKRIIIQ